MRGECRQKEFDSKEATYSSKSFTGSVYKYIVILLYLCTSRILSSLHVVSVMSTTKWGREGGGVQQSTKVNWPGKKYSKNN